MESRKSCLVSGALGLVLRLSRPVGIAPLRFVKHRQGWFVSVSPVHIRYSFFFITVLNLTNLIGLVMDLMDRPDKSVRVSTPGKRALWIVDLTIVTVVASAAGYSSPQIMKQTIFCLNQLEKINFGLKKYKTKKNSEKRNIALTAFALIGFLSLIVTDYVSIICDGIKKESSVPVLVLYCSYSSQYTMLQLIQMQFVFIALRLHTTMATVNNGLKYLLRDDNKQMASNHSSKKVVPIKMLSSVTDAIGIGVIATGTSTSPTRQTSETIRCLSHSYSCICDLVKQIDRSFGLTILLLFCSFLFHMVASQYYFITTLIGRNAHTQAQFFHQVTLQLVWSAYHFVNCVVVVEPAHRTSEEMEVTKELVMQLMRTNSQCYDGQLTIELDLFYRQLLLDRTLYAPLRVFTINRSVIAALLGSVTTYLVIVTQI